MYSDYSPPLFYQPLPTHSFPGFLSLGLGLWLISFNLDYLCGHRIGAAHGSLEKSSAATQPKAMHSSLPGWISSKQFIPGWVGLLRPSSIPTVSRPILCSPRAGIPSSCKSVTTVAVFPWSWQLTVLPPCLPALVLLFFCSLLHSVPWALQERIWTPCLGPNTQLSGILSTLCTLCVSRSYPRTPCRLLTHIFIYLFNIFIDCPLSVGYCSHLSKAKHSLFFFALVNISFLYWKQIFNTTYWLQFHLI